VSPFSFHTPTAVEDAARLLVEHGDRAAVIAGGQTLLLALKERQVRPEHLVSLTGIPELGGLSTGPDGELVVGATTTYAALATAALPGWQAEIARVAGDLADRPVRNLGTIGGALCAADPRFDMLTLAVGTGARLDLVGPDGVRTTPAEEFFEPEGGHRLQAGELLVAVRFPGPDAYTRVRFRKFRHRTFDAALASVLLAVRAEDGRLTDVRLTAGAVRPAPVLAERAMARLSEAEPGAVDGDEVASLVVDEVLGDRGDRPLVEYQRELIRSLTCEVLAAELSDARS
jgi:carbon-monoxide dehydrogenase medium subunit